MINTSNALVNIIINGVIYTLLSMLAESFLKISGLTRGNFIGLVTVAFTLSIFSELLDFDVPLYVYILILVIIGPFSVNRADLTTTLRDGRRWWMSENHLKRIESKQDFE